LAAEIDAVAELPHATVDALLGLFSNCQESE
jgi:hypothetical protein